MRLRNRLTTRPLALERLEERTLLSAGDLDVGFGSAGRVTTDFGSDSDSGFKSVQQSDGKIVVAGHTGTSGGVLAFALARYNTDGTLDQHFGSGGKVITDLSPGYDVALDVAVQPDGKILAAGYANHVGVGTADFALVRYNPDGSLDPSFGGGDGITISDFGSHDVAWAMALQPDGKIVLAGGRGSPPDFALARYNTDGSLDGSFGTGGLVTTHTAGSAGQSAYGVVIQSDGRIVAGGVDSDVSQVPHFLLIRYNANGSIDTGYGASGFARIDFGTSSSDWMQDIALQPDGKVVAGGYSNALEGGNQFDFALARVNASGTLDTGFGVGGKVLTDIHATEDALEGGLAVQPDGKIVMVGYSNNVATGSDFAIARYTVGGNLDAGFGSGGLVVTDFGTDADLANDVVIQSDSKIVVVGRSTSGASGVDFALARYDGGVLPPRVAQIDVKPGSRTNPINLTMNGVIPVVLFKTANFDPAQVDVATVLFANAHAVQSAFEDVDGDGDLDLVLHFRLQSTNLLQTYRDLVSHDLSEDGDLDSSRKQVSMTLTGTTLDGQSFEGSDVVELFLAGKALRDLLKELGY